MWLTIRTRDGLGCFVLLCVVGDVIDPADVDVFEEVLDSRLVSRVAAWVREVLALPHGASDCDGADLVAGEVVRTPALQIFQGLDHFGFSSLLRALSARMRWALS